MKRQEEGVWTESHHMSFLLPLLFWYRGSREEMQVSAAAPPRDTLSSYLAELTVAGSISPSAGTSFGLLHVTP